MHGKQPKNIRGRFDLKLSVYFKLDVSVEVQAHSHLEITRGTVIFQCSHEGQVMKAAEQTKRKGLRP